MFTQKLLIVVLSLQCITESVAVEKDVALLEGRTIGQVDSIVAMFKTDYFINLVDEQTRVLHVVPDSAGLFRLELRPEAYYGKLSTITIYHNGKHQILRDYLVAKGDHIQMTVSSREGALKVTFTGQGSDKYNCRMEIENCYSAVQKGYQDLTGSFAKGKHYDVGNLSKILAYRDQANDNMLATLENYKSRLNPLERQIMAADIRARLVLKSLVTRSFYLAATNPADQRTIVGDASFLTATEPSVADSVATMSFYYVQSLLIKIKLREFIKSQGQGVPFKEVYLRLKGEFTGELRDRLVTLWLVSPLYQNTDIINSNPDDFKWCLDDAHSFVKSTVPKREITKMIASLKKGVPAFDFSLVDTSGNKRSLSEFKGKVVLMDIWFTGCTGCILFARKFKEQIYPSFNGNPDLVVVSISIDSSKERWLKSVEGGRYTQPEHVNLFTEGLGDRHPLIKHYGLKGYPTVILIDRRGQIVSKVSTDPNAHDVVEVIQLVLNQK